VLCLSASLCRAAEVIVDNAAPTGVTVTGTWTAGTNPGYWGTNYIHDGNWAKGTKSVRFTPNLPAAGEYDVFLWWSASSNRATNVPVDVTYSGGTDLIEVNEQLDGSQWNLLGTYNFTAGTAGNVLIANTGTNGYVFADAVKFVSTRPNPFGVSMSSSRVDNLASWVGPIASTGAGWVRGFKGINNITPSPGTYNWVQVDAYLAAAAANNMNVCGIINYNASWINPNTQTFPTDNLPAWGNYVTALVNHSKNQVRHWEVGNEPPNYTSGGTPAQYASTMITAYDAAKAEDPTCKIGLAAKSADINWLYRTINAGAADHFDFITLHPYEVFDQIGYGWEAQFMSLVPTIRKMLADRNPAKVDVPVWFTELGQPVGSVNGSLTFTDTIIAENLVKAYSMGLAQGVSVITWFEGREGDSGPFGLISSAGVQRPAYTAFSKVIQYLGTRPDYIGWVQLNTSANPDRDYGFVFQGATTTVMAAWAPPGVTDTINFGQTVQIINPVTGSVTSASSYSLTNSPILVVGVPAALVTQATTNKTLPFPWDGDYTSAPSVAITMGGPNTEAGLHHLKADVTSTAVTTPYGPARDCNKITAGIQKGTAQYITVDPNFSSYTTGPLQITAVVRRNAANDAASVAIAYESTSGMKTTTSQSVPGNTQWYTLTWTINDAQFVGNYGYNFYLSSASPRYYIQSLTVTKLTPSTVNFSTSPTSSYATQDSVNGSVAVEDAGATLKLTGNLWKKIGFSYTVTSGTVLEFDFKAAGPEGEIQAIGIETDNVEGGSGCVIFQLQGTQTYANQTFNTHTSTDWVHYSIPIGAHTTGSKAHLVFISDKDSSPYTSESFFRNVTVHE
jgi:hypothetical protein